MVDIEFLRLTTDICYIIGGFFGGTGPNPEDNVLTFMQDTPMEAPIKAVYLDLNQKMLFASDEFTRLQIFALESVAKRHGYGYDIFHEDE